MATIKTVKPGGGGDYSTLATWNTAAAAVTEVSGDVYHAECYSGGSLGAMFMGSYAITPTSSKYPRIYAAAGHGHTLATPSSSTNAGGYVTSGSTNTIILTITVNFTRIEGLSFLATNTTAIAPTLITLAGGSASDVLISGVLIVLTGTAASTTSGTPIFIRAAAAGNAVSATIQNATFVANLSSGSGITGFTASAVPSATSAANWLNCVSINVGTASAMSTGFSNGDARTTTVTTNCIACGAATCYFGTQTQTTNISSDTTATGTALDSKTAASIFTAPTSNWTTLSTSSSVGAGTDLSATFTADALGVTRSVPWDIGSYEFPSGNSWYYNQLLGAA